MDDRALRALVRDAVARHLGSQPTAPRTLEVPAAPVVPAVPVQSLSFAVYTHLPVAGEACVIEPNVGCDHCGYCKSHGH